MNQIDILKIQGAITGLILGLTSGLVITGGYFSHPHDPKHSNYKAGSVEKCPNVSFLRTVIYFYKQICC